MEFCSSVRVFAFHGDDNVTMYATAPDLPMVRDASPDLGDPAKFVLVPAVALLDEHYRTRDHDGERVREHVGVDQLTVICENTQRRAEYGDYPILFLGHADYSKLETELPEIVGYLSNFRMGRDRRDRDVIIADMHIKKSRYELLDQYPRRSVEMFGKQTPAGYIDAVALLKRSPERDLGLVTYASGREVELYTCRDCREELGETMSIEPEDLQAIIAGVVPGIVQGMQEFFSGLMQEPEAEPEMPPEEAPETMDTDQDGTPDVDDPAPMDSAVGGDESSEPYGAGMPSGTDTNPASDRVMRPEDRARERTTMSSDEDKIEIAHLRRLTTDQDRRLKAIEAENRRVNERYQASERKLAIARVVEDNHLNVDPDAEFNEFAKDLTPEQFSKHLTRMPSLYSKAPDSLPEVPVDRTHPAVRIEREGIESAREPLPYKEVDKYAKRNKIDVSVPGGANEAIAGFLAERAAKKSGTANGKPAYA